MRGAFFAVLMLSATSAASANAADKVSIKPKAYVEVYYAYNLNRPSNGITNFRGFDNRHNTFTLSNVALGTDWEVGHLTGKVMLQVGSTGATYYASEPMKSGGTAANPSNPELWRYVQEANFTYNVGRLGVTAGIMPAPVGLENFAVKDHWNWSRSNLYFGLPFYTTGVVASYQVTDHVVIATGVDNGWNNVVDNNDAKNVRLHVIYKPSEWIAGSLLYWGGVERNDGAPEGPAWRHIAEMRGEGLITRSIALHGQLNGGFENNRFGTANWWAVSLASRIQLRPWLYFAYRWDRFTEHLATSSARGSSTPIFWGGSEWVSSGTSTLDFRPHTNLSIRLEHRVDFSEKPLFYRAAVTNDIPNANGQQTILLGATAWL